MPVFLVDMDGVLANFSGRFDQLWQERHPDKPFTPWEERTSWYIEDNYPEELHDLIFEIAREPGYFRTLDPLPGAVEGINKLTELGDVWICTAPLTGNPTCASDKMDWAAEHLGEQWRKRLVITKDKTLVRGDFLIDDKPLIKGSMVPQWTHILFQSPGITEDHPVQAKDWDHLIKSFGRLLGK
jgi:5'-nucleotidase